MSQKDEEKIEEKEAMKRLRAARKQTIKAAAARMKEQKKAIKAIKERLEDQAGTVPEIAEATGITTSEVIWYLAALKNYGQVIEREKDGSYFRYQWAGSGH
jgi:predicted Rossmann fold nucleotide-binding protein DprA/Smf involved in DNA uptake